MVEKEIEETLEKDGMEAELFKKEEITKAEKEEVKEDKIPVETEIPPRKKDVKDKEEEERDRQKNKKAKTKRNKDVGRNKRTKEAPPSPMVGPKR